MSDDVSILAGDAHQLRMLDYLSEGGDVTCYLDVSNPLHYTPVVPASELPPGVEQNRRLDILHDAHRYIPGEDEYILFVADYRVVVPWPGDMSVVSQMSAVDEAGSLKEHAEYDLRVDRID